MAKRLDFSRAAKERRVKLQGAERLDDPGVAEQARIGFRNVINERDENPEPAPGIGSHSRIAQQARSDFQKGQDADWRIVPAPAKLKEKSAKKTRRQKQRSAKKSRS
jgi:hypothetical protein